MDLLQIVVVIGADRSAEQWYCQKSVLNTSTEKMLIEAKRLVLVIIGW
jgi:hypothetical protein